MRVNLIVQNRQRFKYSTIEIDNVSRHHPLFSLNTELAVKVKMERDKCFYLISISDFLSIMNFLVHNQIAVLKFVVHEFFGVQPDGHFKNSLSILISE